MGNEEQNYQCTCEACMTPEQYKAMWREEIIKLVVSSVLFVAGWIISEFTKLPSFVFLLCFAVSYILVGFDVVRNAVVGIMNKRIFNEHLLITIASLGAFAIKEYHEGCAVMILYTVGELCQFKAVDNSRKNIIFYDGETHRASTTSSNRFLSKFARVYTPIICILSILIILIPPIFMNGEWNEWLHRGLSALVISCPCAIVVSVPLCFYSGIGACSKLGVYVADAGCIEILKDYDKSITEEKAEADGILFSEITDDIVEKSVAISKKSLLLARENIAISLCVKVVVLVLSVFLEREVPMWLAAFSDVGICFIAILNSLRAMRVSKD